MGARLPRPSGDAARLDDVIDLGDRLAPITARVNRRARRLIVKVDSVEGRVLVTAPSKRALPEAMRFAHERIAWIRREFARGDRPRPFAGGAVCPYRGVFHTIIAEGAARAPVRRIDGSAPALLVGGDPPHLNRRLTQWLKAEARREIGARVGEYSARLDRHAVSIQIRDSRSRWGSCSSTGALSFSWRLILAPPSMLDYVAAHECAHLVRLDHSPAFWRTVESLGVDAKAARTWFAAHGASLRAWGVQAQHDSSDLAVQDDGDSI